MSKSVIVPVRFTPEEKLTLDEITTRLFPDNPNVSKLISFAVSDFINVYHLWTGRLPRIFSDPPKSF